MNTTPMSAIWQSLPLEITTMILVETALLPLKVHAHSYLHHRYISALETTNPPSTNAWQAVLSALAINHSTRRAVIHALNTHGAIEHKEDPGVAYTAHFGPQPSWALLAHFRWVFVSVEDRMDRDDVRLFVRMPVPGAVRAVERFEIIGVKPSPMQATDIEVAGLAARVLGRVWVLGMRGCWLFSTVGGGDIADTIADVAEVRTLLFWEEE
ncbi:hypothetical protein TI39_contig4111g00022 [Zymoseptoria brevis]|uniref:Uncharacterized protein n=1 Tax=Zymoseptoria brevis TaxID=1047168 RepID=A0A0F4GES9_9PEZI|nr:hypothetical protein TI39_contig4111g00022 [Zymoseptoria brevis]